jgi:uncharacterized protein
MPVYVQVRVQLFIGSISSYWRHIPIAAALGIEGSPSPVHIRDVDQAVAIARLRPFERRLRERGVSALYLFGSTARAEAHTGSDIDLLFDYDPTARFTLFTQAGLMQELSDGLGTKIDLIARDGLRPHFRERVEKDMIRVF